MTVDDVAGSDGGCQDANSPTHLRVQRDLHHEIAGEEASKPHRPHRRFIAYRGDNRRVLNGVDVWPYRKLLEELAAGFERA